MSPNFPPKHEANHRIHQYLQLFYDDPRVCGLDAQAQIPELDLLSRNEGFGGRWRTFEMEAAGRTLRVFEYSISGEEGEVEERELLVVAVGTVFDWFEHLRLGEISIETAELIISTSSTADGERQDRTLEVRGLENALRSAAAFDTSVFRFPQ